MHYAIFVKGMLLTYSHVFYVFNVNPMPGQFNINRGWPSSIKNAATILCTLRSNLPLAVAYT